MLQESVRLEVSSNPQMSSLVRKVVGRAAEMVGFCDNEASQITLAVDEAITNVIRHTYRMDTGQRIRLHIICAEGSHLDIEIADDGPPVDVAAIKRRSLEEVRPGGLGVNFIREIMDSVEYLPQRPAGNVLRMRKYRKDNRPCAGRLQDAGKDPQLLSALLEIGQSLPWILHLQTLLDMIVRRVTELMRSEGASVLLLDEERQELVFHTLLDDDAALVQKLQGLRFPANKGIAGRVLHSGQPVLVSDVDKDPDHFRDVDEKTGGRTQSLLYAPLQVRDRVIGILSAKNKKDGRFDDADIAVLTAIAGTVALSVDNACAHEKLRDTDRIEKELHAASRMHQATLPRILPSVPGLAASAVCVPAHEVGGDYYDCFALGDGRFAFAIGDVSGHGLEAGMMVSMARSCLYTQLHFSYAIGEVMQAMNRMVYGSVERRLMMTFLFLIYDQHSGELVFANAGHPSPYHYDAAGRQWQLVDQGEFPLGVRASHDYPAYACGFRPGDLFVLYSDGIVEAANQRKERYGFDRLHKLLAGRDWTSPWELQDAIVRDVAIFADGCPAADDRTLLVLQRQK